MKLTIQMSMGSNEMAVLEIPVDRVDQWDARVVPVLKKLEERCGDRARRIMAGNKQMRELLARDPETGNMAHNLVLLCMGAIPEPTVLGTVDGIENQIPPALQLQTNEEGG